MEPPSPSPLRRRRPPGQDVNALADIAFSPAQAAAPPDTPKPVPLCGHAALAKPPKPAPLARAGGFCTFRAVRGKRPFPARRRAASVRFVRFAAKGPSPARRRAASAPVGPSSSSPLRSGGPAGRFRPASGPNWNRFRVKIFVFAPADLDGIPAKWYRMILVGGWRIAVHAAGRIHSPAAHAANPSFSTAPRNKYAPAGRHTRAAFAPQRNVRWEELHCRTFWICSPT